MSDDHALPGAPLVASGGEVALVDVIAAAVLSVDGVAGLNAGRAGTAATLLPGRRVAGIRISDEASEVHISVGWDNNVMTVADGVRAAVFQLTGKPVHVTIEDVAVPAALSSSL